MNLKTTPKQNTNLYGLLSILLALIFTACNQAPVNSNAGSNQKFAYVSVDSLLFNYKEYQELSEEFLAERQKSEMQLQSKAVDLQKEAANFQEKMQKGFYSKNQAASIQQELMQKEQKIRKLQAEVSQQLQTKQMEIRKKIMTKIDSLIEIYAEQNNLDYVLSEPLFAKPANDITAAITEMLNK